MPSEALLVLKAEVSLIGNYVVVTVICELAQQIEVRSGPCKVIPMLMLQTLDRLCKGEMLHRNKQGSYLWADGKKSLLWLKQ